MLQIKKISKSIKGKKIVSNITFSVESGEVFGLLGPNGAGKTTIFYIIAGLMNCDNGKIILSNKTISNISMHNRSKLGINYLPQEPSIFQNLTVYENLYGLAELSFSCKKDIRNFLNCIEKTIIETLKNFGIETFSDKNNIGIWYNNDGIISKVAAIGIKVKKWIAYHGFAININNNLDQYKKIIPCGIKDKGITNLISIKDNDYSNLDDLLIDKFISNLKI